MKMPKEMEGHFCSILLAGIATQEVKIKRILTDEIIAEYIDKEEVHIDPNYIRAWWPDPRRDSSAINARKAAVKRRAKEDLRQRQTEDLSQDEIITQEGNN